MPEASVIVTCYNLERYIGAAIESVLRQEFQGEPEIIVVDDGSTDRSAEIIRSYPQVRYLNTGQNEGVLLATLAGIDAASSDVLFFLDGDDIWEPAKLAVVMSRFSSDEKIGLVTHDLTYANAAGQPLARPTRPAVEMAGVQGDKASAKIRSGILAVGDYVWLGSALAVRRSIIKIGEFVEFARSLPDPANTYQDWPLAYWVAAQSDVELDYVPDKLFRYRLHGFNYSGNARTSELAIRNLTRALNTSNAMAEIGRINSLDPRIIRIVERQVRFYKYLIDLNRGRRANAVRGFLRNLPEMVRRRVLLNELLRFVAVQAVGPRRFSRMAARRKLLRNFPVT